MRNLLVLKLGRFNLYAGWVRDYVVTTKFAWYSYGLYLGQLVVEWEIDNGARTGEQSAECSRKHVPSFGDIPADGESAYRTEN